jgi:3-hydroxyisobutyrate dehydrogenase-like beta-hydroxyacid dehydrogenase
MAKLGFVGLGVMGSAITERLLAAGHEVTGYNRTRSKAEALAPLGLRVVDTPRQVAEAADVVFSMVTDTEALRGILDGPDGLLAALGPGKVYVDMSTVSPSASREAAAGVRAKGAAMLDAPVSGSVPTVKAGQLSIMVGGDPDVLERVKPYLLDIGPTVNRVGDNGQAVAMKIATNLSLATQVLAFSEGVLLAERSGIPRETAVQVLLNSVIASPMLKYRGPFVLGLPEQIWFNVEMARKDGALAMEMGRELGVPLPTTALVSEFLTAAAGMGYADEEFAALFHTLARMAGVEP